jgi:hypothetical protein
MTQKIVLALLLGALLTLAKASAEDKAKPSDAPGSVASKEFDKNGDVYTYDETGEGLLRKVTVSDTSVSKKLQEDLNRYGKAVFGSSGMKVKEVPATFTVPAELWVSRYEKKVITEDGSFFLVSKDDKVLVFQASSVGESNLPTDDKDKYRNAACEKIKEVVDGLHLEIAEPQVSQLAFSFPASSDLIRQAYWSYGDPKRYQSAKHGRIECIPSLTSIDISIKGDHILRIIDVPVIRPEKESVKCTEKEILEFAGTLFPELPREISKANLIVYDERPFALFLDRLPRKPYLAWEVEWKSGSERVAEVLIDDESKTIIESVDMRTK